MNKLPAAQFEQAKKAGQALNAAAKSLRVLSSVEWSAVHRSRFLNKGTLPKPRYAKVKTSHTREYISKARSHIDGEDVVFEWLDRLANTLETTVNLIETRGTPEFFTHSVSLYGQPTQFMLDGKTRVIDLARHMDASLTDLDFSKLVMDGVEHQLTSHEFAAELCSKLERHFGASAPKVKVTEALSAKAVAGSKRIRVRESASFTERDVEQLLQHEALIHSATGLNGNAQKHFKVLGRAHAGTTEIQEGLAVFAEIISGAMDPTRFRRLADRVMAIQMAIDGADFKEVYDFYADRTDPDQAYDNTRRVFRGGVIGGGAPFTKDMVYLNGLLRVHNFMRSIVKIGRADLIRILFCGKMDLEDLPALAQLASTKRLTPPKFMPPWAKDLRFLVSYMAYSSFLNQVKMPGFQKHYEEELKDVPVIWGFGN